EALAFMNDTDYGLTAAVYTSDRARAERLLARANTGTAYWNCCDRVSPRLPWTGRGASGLGVTLAREGIAAFVRPKAWHLRGVWLLASGVALAVDAETVGKVMTLPERPGPHWFWLSDILLHRTALFDADTGGLLGTISSGTAGVGFVIAPLFSPDHREIYLAETYYARGVRGTRTDVVTVYDAATLRPLGDEI